MLFLSLTFNELTFTPSERGYSDYDPWGHQGLQGGRDMVQVYGLGLEYGFVSDSAREPGLVRGSLPRPGARLSTRGARFR